ncbi:MAG: pyridoxal-phosphate dependent enzyme, partial [Chloroflexota bacterium]
LKAIHCLTCGHTMPAQYDITHCSNCQEVWLDAHYDYKSLPDSWPELLKKRPTTLWRYNELLPFCNEMDPVSIGEGWTPLIRAAGIEQAWPDNEIWIKDERQQPTNSFKDRQAAPTITALKAQGIEELVIASTGNAAAAYAAYCARACIKLWVFLPSSVPSEKMRELALYGAEVIKVTGSYDETKKIAADFASRRGIHFDKGAKAIPGKEGLKTLAFEIAEQLNWQAPDWYIQAVSGGIGPLGVLKGFTELYQCGLIDRIPKLGLVQSAGCAPMVHAWEQGFSQAEPVKDPNSLITVLGTGDPGLAYTILKNAADQNGGAMVSVEDGEAFRAMRRIARTEGFSVEPATSVAFAGLQNLLADGHIQAGERVVVNCSGHTFSAEKHTLESQYVLHLDSPSVIQKSNAEGLETALKILDEQVTTVVVIDDNPHDTRLVRRLLEGKRQYRVFETHNGPDGLELIRQRRPGLVILDLKLPDMDGFSILEAIKLDPTIHDTPVTILSAKSLTTEERRYLNRYTEAVWQKGEFKVDSLVNHVVETLESNI